MAVASLALLHKHAHILVQHDLRGALRCWRLHARRGARLGEATAATARRVVAVRSAHLPTSVGSRHRTDGRPRSQSHSVNATILACSGHTDGAHATGLACALRRRSDLAAAFGAWAGTAMATAATRRLRHRLAMRVRVRLGAAFMSLEAGAQWRSMCRHAVRTFVWRGGAMAMRTWLAQVARTPIPTLTLTLSLSLTPKPNPNPDPNLAQVAVALSRKFSLRRAASHWRQRRARATLCALRAHARGAYATGRELARLQHASGRAEARALRAWREAGTLRRLVSAVVARRMALDCRRALASWMEACALRLARCQPTLTPTLTLTPTFTLTPTLALTFTLTLTPTPDPNPTQAACQLHRRTARMLTAHPLRGAWSALRAGGARWSLLRRCVVASLTNSLLGALDTWRGAAAEARGGRRALHRRQRGALVAALAAWRGGAAPLRRLCEITSRCMLLPLTPTPYPHPNPNPYP